MGHSLETWHMNQILRDFDTEKWPKGHLFWLRFQIFGKIATLFDHVYEASRKTLYKPTWIKMFSPKQLSTEVIINQYALNTEMFALILKNVTR